MSQQNHQQKKDVECRYILLRKITLNPTNFFTNLALTSYDTNRLN